MSHYGPADPQVARALSRLVVLLQTLPETTELRTAIRRLRDEGLAAEKIGEAYRLASGTTASDHHGQTGSLPSWEDVSAGLW